MDVQSLSKDWITQPLLRLLFQNLIVEERSDVRDATVAAWRTSLSLLQLVPGRLQNSVTPELALEWSALVTTPMGVPIDTALFFNPIDAADPADASAPERHNVDKNMLAQDLTLVLLDTIWLARIAAASAFGYLIYLWAPPVRSFDFTSYSF